jgi:ATP/maltotriose-dependent transcriptional regulator MalT
MAGDNEIAVGRARGAEAAALGQRIGDSDLAVLGLALEGVALVLEGQMADGMSRLDEATAATSAGEVTGLDAIILAYCYLIFACHRVRDYERAAQWCETAKAMAERWAMRQCFSVCRSHYAGVLMWRGEWDEAESELTAALRYLGDARPPMAATTLLRLGQLRLLQGRPDEAADLFAQAEGHPLALLGRGEIAYDADDPAAASALAERYLRGLPWNNRVDRVPGLELLVRARAAERNVDGARDALAELRQIADRIATSPLRASACESEAAIAGATGDHDLARRNLEDAVDLYEQSGSPFHAARARIALGRELLATGRRDAAVQEARAGRDALLAIGAVREAARADALLAAGNGRPSDDGGLTRREVEILRLVADGLGNREIAAQLVVSEHTVHRHVANILAKLRVSSRASAVALAARRGLI